MIEKFESKGFYIEECGLPGEGKAEECVPAQHNTIQLSHNRWFVIFETRGFRGVDDNRSVIYQVRADKPFGPVLAEGCLDKAIQHWDPIEDGSDYVKLCNHSVAFGVPKGAVLDGKPVPQAGVFAAAWRANPRFYDRESGYLLLEEEKKIPPNTYRCYWVQFTLNDSDDDILIVQDKMPLRQRGYESGPAVCAHPDLQYMNQGYVLPVPYSSDCSEWAFLLHWSQGSNEPKGVCTAIRLRWNQETKRYEWVETGPILDGPGKLGIFEGGIAPYKSDWLVSARITPATYGNIWFRTENLFGFPPKPVFSDTIGSLCPRTTYAFPDGKIRVFTTDQINSPYQDIPVRRIPLNVFEVDPENGFAVTRRQVVFDSIEEGIPISRENAPTMHFCRLLPHTGGQYGYVTYFVRPRAIKNRAYAAGRFKGMIKPGEIEVSGVYYSRFSYDREYSPTWRFA